MWKLADECGKEGGLGTETRQKEASVVHDVGRLETTENSILNARLDSGRRTERWAILAGLGKCWTKVLDAGRRKLKLRYSLCTDREEAKR